MANNDDNAYRSHNGKDYDKPTAEQIKRAEIRRKIERINDKKRLNDEIGNIFDEK